MNWPRKRFSRSATIFSSIPRVRRPRRPGAMCARTAGRQLALSPAMPTEREAREGTEPETTAWLTALGGRPALSDRGPRSQPGVVGRLRRQCVLVRVRVGAAARRCSTPQHGSTRCGRLLQRSCTVLSCTTRHCTGSCCASLHCDVLFCIALHCAELHNTTLHWIVLHCTAHRPRPLIGAPDRVQRGPRHNGCESARGCRRHRHRTPAHRPCATEKRPTAMLMVQQTIGRPEQSRPVVVLLLALPSPATVTVVAVSSVRRSDAAIARACGGDPRLPQPSRTA